MIHDDKAEPVEGRGRESSTAGNSEPSPAGQALNNQFQNRYKLA